MLPFGLTCPDLSLAPGAENRPKMPTKIHFVAPLLHVLGEKSGYRPRVFLDPRYAPLPRYTTGDNKGQVIPKKKRTPEQLVACKRKPLRDAVLRAAGYNPDEESTLPRPLRTRTPVGLYRIIWYAVEGDSEEPSRPKKNHKPLFVIRRNSAHADDVSWALTERGVALAAYLRPHFATDNRNVTAVWLDGQMKSGLYQKLYEGLLYDPKLARERAANEVADHLQTFLTGSITRNAFRSWLVRGDAPTVRQMRQWALRKGISAFRGYAQDSHQRAMRGALTKAERNNGGVSLQSMVPSDFCVVFQNGPEEDQPSEVIVNTAATDQFIHEMAGIDGLERIREAIRRHKPGAPDRYALVFDLMRQGYTVEEIGRRVGGVSRNRAATIMADCRKALREAVHTAQNACALLWWLLSALESAGGSSDPMAPIIRDYVIGQKIRENVAPESQENGFIDSFIDTTKIDDANTSTQV